jgi:NADP-dependent 3-hydroxy acid dehydrogenase YdfG
MPQLTWFITGCSSGFGEALVLEVARRGDRVIATSRRIEDIAHLKGENIRTLALDVASSQDDINECILSAQEIFGSIDVLVNNAGYLQAGAMEQVRWAMLHHSPSYSEYLH